MDFDHSLNATVNRLRDILRDSAANPRFVETVPRRGYRFIAPVERTDEAAETRAPMLAGTAAPSLSGHRMEVDPAFSPDGSQVAFAWNGGEGARTNLDVFVKVVGDENPRRLTLAPEDDDNPAWSPDGRYIAFARWISNDRVEYILVSPLGNGEQKMWDSRARHRQDLRALPRMDAGCEGRHRGSQGLRG